MAKSKLIPGQIFSKLTCIKQVANSRFGQIMWECLCECGNTKTIVASYLLTGHTTSCGCYGKSIIGKRNKTHGMSSSPLYKIWIGIKKRCYNPKKDTYKHYGGRGIKVCDRWLNSFENFKIDMEPGYKKGLTIDRIDNNLDYSPSNCKWATMTEQGNNKRNNRMLTCNGITKTLSQFARESGIAVRTIHQRLQSGWSDFDAINTPVKKKLSKNIPIFQGENKI